MAAEVAPIGHRQAEAAEWPAERIDDGHLINYDRRPYNFRLEDFP